MFSYFLAEKFKGIHFQFFVENVARGNSVQIHPNFPAKSLKENKNHTRTLLSLFDNNNIQI